MIRGRILFWIAAALGAIIVLYFTSPLLGAFIWSYRVNHSIKIQTNYPGCVPGKELPDSLRCECEFVFGGVGDAASLTFEGDLRKIYDARTRTFQVTGTGTIRHGRNEIVISSDRVSINRTELPPDRPSSFHALITPEGTLKGSRVDISW